MTSFHRIAAAAALTFALLGSACSSLTGSGAHKLVLSEPVCVNARFLKMKLNQQTTIVLDNNKAGPTQKGLSVTLSEFPVIIVGDVPQGSTIGANFSTIRLSTAPKEQKTVVVLPTGTGSYEITCNISLTTQSGLQVQQKTVTVQITQ
jgi:hypothetical protein